MKLCQTIANAMLLGILALGGGCALFPETRYRDALHNPFPQLNRVAVLPFFNQSSEPTVDAEQVAESYFAALQSIPGFEVLPVGVTRGQWLSFATQYGEPRTGADFQRLAQFLEVDAVVVGSLTDFDAYYPPRIGLAVHWYAANEGFHPIPVGYGMPWGTDAEDQIPARVVRDAEFELARSQLRTQTPVPAASASGLHDASVRLASEQLLPETEPLADPEPLTNPEPLTGPELSLALTALPPDWPSPTALIPDPPSPQRPVTVINHAPVLTHTRLYRGDDPYVTGRLADYVETGDDARPSGWQGYLHRSDDFVRFCCHLHVVEMLESRGGRDESDLILRWRLSRY